MRKSKRLLLMLALAAVLTLLCATALAAEFVVVEGTQTLNLRQKPASNSEWLGRYTSGTWVEVTGASGNWYSVYTPDGKTGYMSKNYLSSGSVNAGVVAVVSNPKASQFLNLRSAPSFSASVITILYNGVPMPVLGNSNGWIQVSLSGQTGYVRSEYVTLRSWAGSSNVATIKTPNNTALNLRAGPGSAYPVIRQFAGDQYVMVLKKGNGWWRVCAEGYEGFMSSDFLQEGLKAARDIAGQSSGGGGGGLVGAAYGIVTNPYSGSYLNLREQPTTAARVLGVYFNGARVSIIAQGGEWCEVMVDADGKTGFMMTKYLTIYGGAQLTRQIKHPQGSYVNLRQSPSMTAAVLVRLPSGASVTVLTPGTDWVEVSYNGVTGYVVAYFLN